MHFAAQQCLKRLAGSRLGDDIRAQIAACTRFRFQNEVCAAQFIDAR